MRHPQYRCVLLCHRWNNRSSQAAASPWKYGSEEYKPLSSLFKSEKLLECYNEDLIFTFQSIMDEPAGENLRNLNGHGLLEPSVGNSASSLYFVSLLVFLLSLYGANARPIHIELSMREQQEANDKDMKG